MEVLLRRRKRSAFHRVLLFTPVSLKPQGVDLRIPLEPDWAWSGPWQRRQGIKHPFWHTKAPIWKRKKDRQRRSLSC